MASRSLPCPEQEAADRAATDTGEDEEYG